MKRRTLFSCLLGNACYASLNALTRRASACQGLSHGQLESRMAGLLVGGLVGDAAGGPFEFASTTAHTKLLPRTREWPTSQRLNAATIEELANTFKLHAYKHLRPQTAPYGPWKKEAEAGTITDDSRHKLILFDALRQANTTQSVLTRRHLAQAYLEFHPRDPTCEPLNEEGFREYHYAARWVLGERDLHRSKPISRLWSGIANCSGQMLLPPLAACFPGEPDIAYQRTYQLDFVDAPLAKDFVAAINAGLASALASPQIRARDRWKTLLATMRQTDPYQMQDVPFAGRPLNQWLDLAEKFAREANGQPARLFERLETDGAPKYWWDAHFTLLTAFSLLHISEFNGLAAMQLALDFGHDADSYAQLIGCMTGAIDGIEVFPESMRKQVLERVKIDFGGDLSQWMTSLKTQAKISQLAAANAR